MNPFNLIPSAYLFTAKAAFIVALPIAIFYAGWHYSHAHYAAAQLVKDQAAQIAHDAQLSKLIDTANTKLAAQTAKINEDRNAYDKLKQATALAAADSHRQLDSLRRTNAALLAAAVDPATTAARCGDYATRASDVLGQCSARLVDVAKDADGCAAKLSAAQDYIKAALTAGF